MLTLMLAATTAFRAVYAAAATDPGLRRSRIISAVALAALTVQVGSNSSTFHELSVSTGTLSFEVITIVQQISLVVAGTAGMLLVAGLDRRAEDAAQRTVQRAILVALLVTVGAVALMVCDSDNIADRPATHIYQYTLERAADTPFVYGLIIVQVYSVAVAAVAAVFAGRQARCVARRADALSMRLLQVGCLILCYYAAARVVVFGAATAGWMELSALEVAFLWLSVVAMFGVLSLCLAFLVTPLQTRVDAVRRIVGQRQIYRASVQMVPAMRPTRSVGDWSVQRIADARATSVFDILTVLLTYPGVWDGPVGPAEAVPAPKRARAVAEWMDRQLVDPMPAEWLTPPPGVGSAQWLEMILSKRSCGRSPFPTVQRGKVSH